MRTDSRKTSTFQRQEETIVDLALNNAATIGASVAYRFLSLSDDGERVEMPVTYREIDHRAREIGAFLQSADTAPSRPILLLFNDGARFVEAFFGSTYAGRPAVPLAVPRTQEQFAGMLGIAATCGATEILIDRALYEKIASMGLVATVLAGFTFTILEDIAGGGENWSAPETDAQDTAFLQFTSGSTGSPKGVVVTHRNIMANQAMIEQGFAQAHDARVLGWLPLYHDMGLIGNVLNPFWMRRECILMPPEMFLRNPAVWLESISDYQITTSGGPNFAFDLCVKKVVADPDRLNLENWRIAFVGSDPVRASTLRAFTEKFGKCGFNANAFYPCYGLAEATLIVSGGQSGGPLTTANADCSRPDTDDAAMLVGGKLVGCGRALGDLELCVVNPSTRRECAASETGEIWLKGQSIASGYFADAEKTAATFEATLEDGRGPYLRTGDLGFVQDGHLFLRGRLKNMIILNGNNVFAEDVQRVVDGCHPVLKPGLVSAFPVDLKDQEHLGVLVEARSPEIDQTLGAQISDAVRAAVLDRLGLHTGLVAVCGSGVMPRTTSGKIQHFRSCALATTDQSKTLYTSRKITGMTTPGKPAPTGTTSGALGEPTAEKIRDWLCQEIATLADVAVDQIDPTANFASFGITSIDAIQLTDSLGKELALEFDETLFWEYSSPVLVGEFAMREMEEHVA